MTAVMVPNVKSMMSYPRRCRSSSPRTTSSGQWFGAVGVNHGGQDPPGATKPAFPRPPRGQGHRPLTAKTRVRIPVGSLAARLAAGFFIRASRGDHAASNPSYRSPSSVGGRSCLSSGASLPSLPMSRVSSHLRRSSSLASSLTLRVRSSRTSRPFSNLRGSSSLPIGLLRIALVSPLYPRVWLLDASPQKVVERGLHRGSELLRKVVAPVFFL